VKEKITQAAAFLKSNKFENTNVAIVLGTGLGKLIDKLKIIAEIEYEKIPHFPTATVEFHGGSLVYGFLNGVKVIVLHGRFHLYEGYSLEEITFPVRVLAALGVKSLVISNAAGALNLSYKKGDLMMITDHINLQGGSPLAFKGAKEFGNIFVDMGEPYDGKFQNILRKKASELHYTLHEGVYASVVGPQLETKAEYKMLNILGADAVGMSTVPEVIVARQLNMAVAAISILTDECDPDNLQAIDIPQILEVVSKAEPKLIELVENFIAELD
jgi:purine-nucleoside phosphorylase